MGYDKPKHLGRGATGGHLAAPIARDFYKVALADKPAIPFVPPPGIKLIRVDPKTGLRAMAGQPAILEAFKPGTGPPDTFAGVAQVTPDDQPYRVSPEAERAVRSNGTGGLY
jgi:penicillin-binding protein 1A